MEWTPKLSSFSYAKLVIVVLPVSELASSLQGLPVLIHQVCISSILPHLQTVQTFIQYLPVYPPCILPHLDSIDIHTVSTSISSILPHLQTVQTIDIHTVSTSIYHPSSPTYRHFQTLLQYLPVYPPSSPISESRVSFKNGIFWVTEVLL